MISGHEGTKNRKPGTAYPGKADPRMAALAADKTMAKQHGHGNTRLYTDLLTTWKAQKERNGYEGF